VSRELTVKRESIMQESTTNHNEAFEIEEEINLLELVKVVVKRRLLIARFCGSIAILAVVVSLLLPKIYSATAKILPPQKEAYGGLSALLGQMGGLGGLAAGIGIGGSSDLYLGILKSRSVADAVIKRFDLAKEFKTKTPDDTRKVLEKVVKMQAAKDGIITITAEDKDPQRAAALANAFVEELGRKSVQLNLTKAGTERAFLENRLEVVKNELKRAEDDLRSFEVKNKTVKIDSQAAASIQGIARLKAEIISREVQLAALKSYQTNENPEVKVVQTAISKLRSQLDSLAGSGSGGEGIPNIGNVPNLGLEYARKMRQVKIQEAIFAQLTKQYEVAKLTEAKDSPSIQILDDAVVPMKKSKPKRALIVILSTVAAFFASVFFAFILEYFEKMSPEDCAHWEEIRAMMPQRKSSR
jgi:uncharacterized protein involved in exopolysaccharide biosynthesis